MMIKTVTLILLSTLIAAGCKNRQKPTPPPTEPPKPAPVKETVITIESDSDDVDTLELDPADPINIEGWWDNGEVLLEIGFDYSYRIREGRSQNSTVIERGRWTRVNHAEFYLEPYATKSAKRERVALSIDDGVPIAKIKKVPRFKKLQRPPQTIGEEIEGAWRGARGTVAFDRNGTFLLEERSNTDNPIGGTWQVEHGALVLTPENDTHPALVLLIQRARTGQILRLQDQQGPLLPFTPPRVQP